MGISTLVTTARLDDATRDRLSGLGFDLTETVSVAGGVPEAVTAGQAVVVDRCVVDWRRDGAATLTAVSEAAGGTGRPATIVVLPATSTPLAGPVAVLTPAGAAASYEVYVGAAIAAATRRRVEHLNGRGTAGSAVRSSVPTRRAAASTGDWHEGEATRPERALHEFVSRPAVIVVAVAPGSGDAATAIAGHPDADVVLVVDGAHAAHGTAVAARTGQMVELALGMSAPDAPSTSARPRAAARVAAGDPSLPGVRASDVVHVQLTADALVLTNRSRLSIGLRVAVGALDEPDRVRAVFEARLDPESTHTERLDDVDSLGELEGPAAVLRHWSHGDAEVFEGGQRRIRTVEMSVFDGAGTVRADRAYDASNGLDFAVMARDLTALIGGASASVLPEPAPAQALDSPDAADWWGALESAFAVAETALAQRRG